MSLIKLEQYQKEALAFLLQNKHGALFIDPGLGKTAIVLSLLRQLAITGKASKSLVIAPLRPIYTTWPDEIAKWNQFKQLTLQILHGKQRFFNLQQKANVYLANPENLDWIFDWAKSKKQWPFDTLVVDESTKFKNPRSKRFKLLKHYLDKFDRRYIMTGTPTPNSYLDLFSQMYIVDSSILGRFVTHYKAKYFRQGGYLGRQWEIRKSSIKPIQDKVKPHTYTLRDNYILPPQITNDIFIDLDTDLAAQYKSLEKKLFFDLEGNEGTLLASSAAHSYGMCRQFTSGQIYDSDGKILTIHKLKVDTLGDLIAELQGKPLLVAFYYRHELERFKKLFGKSATYADSVKGFGKILTDWNAGKIKILFAQNKSLAHGLNLQFGGNNILWYSLTDSLEDYLQFNRRLQRKGQDKSVVVHRLIVRNTVDELQAARLSGKDKSQTTLLEALHKYRSNKNDKNK